MIARVGFFAAVAGGDVVHVHDGHEDDLSIRAQPAGVFVGAHEPFGEAAGDPTGTGFPCVLSGMGPNYGCCWVFRFIDAEGFHWAFLARGGEGEDFGAGQFRFGFGEEFIGVARGKGRAPGEPERAAGAGHGIVDAFVHAFAGGGVGPRLLISGEGGAIGHGPGGGEGIGLELAVVARGFAAGGEIEGPRVALGDAVHAEIPPAGPAACGIATGCEADGFVCLVDAFDEGGAAFEVGGDFDFSGGGKVETQCGEKEGEGVFHLR